LRPSRNRLFPGYSRYVAAAFHANFIQCGLLLQRGMALLTGCVGAPPQASRWKNQSVTVPDSFAQHALE
jgi:hypothetical protein